MSNILEYKCPCCGGAIEFDSSLQKMKCPYCDTEFEVEAVKAFNEEAASQQPDNLNWDTGSTQNWMKTKPMTCPFMSASPAAARSLQTKAQAHPAARSAAIR